MYPIHKILVCLDLTEVDPYLLKFVSYISQVSSSQKIYFASILKPVNIPEEISKKYPELITYSEKERKKKMEEEVSLHLDTSQEGLECIYEVRHGQKAKKILQLTRELGIDLVIMGKKKPKEGSGVLAQRLARRVACSLLIVPAGFDQKIRKLLVPVDFSDYSKIAVEEAITIAGTRDHSVEIVCQNVYHVPAGYTYTGKTFREFAKIMEKNAEKDFKNFIQKVDTRGVKITPVYSLDAYDDPVREIYKKSKVIRADLVVIGARGRTPATALFLGSMAERLIRKGFKIPLLIVRPKGKNAGIIEYLMEEV